MITYYINSSGCRTTQQAQRITHSCCSIYTQKNQHCYGQQTVDVGDSIRSYGTAFYRYKLKVRMLYRNIFPLTRNGKYIRKGNHFLRKTVPKARDLKKNNIFTMIQFLLLPFFKNSLSFPILLHSTHTQSNTESSQHICVQHHRQ